MNVGDQVIKQGVRNDALFVGRLFRDLMLHEGGELSAALSFCEIPYLSLFLHEARAKAGVIEPGALLEFSQDAEEVCARARHSLKLFEDTKRGVRGQLEYFQDEILAPHSTRFLN